MKMKFTQRIPNFVGGIEPAVFEFETKEELLNLYVVERYVSDDFYRFSLSRHEDTKSASFMLETNEGYGWWVIGYIENIDDYDKLDLPEWEAKYRKFEMKGRPYDIHFTQDSNDIILTFIDNIGNKASTRIIKYDKDKLIKQLSEFE